MEEYFQNQKKAKIKIKSGKIIKSAINSLTATHPNRMTEGDLDLYMGDIVKNNLDMDYLNENINEYNTSLH